MDRLECSILGTVFRNEENGYSVVSVRAGRSEVTVVGVMPKMASGEQAVFTGEWTEHRQYGRQFQCRQTELVQPTTLLGIERYLKSGAIRGIGEHTAVLMVQTFGEDTLTVLSEHPERLTEVPGIGKKRAVLIAESFREQQGTRNAIVFLQSYGISGTLAIRISQLYGDRTPQLIRENPYRLCEDLEGVGFKTADQIGRMLGVAPDSKDRIRSAVRYCLREAASSSGHVFLPEPMLCSQTAALLEIAEELCSMSLREMLLSRELMAEAEEGERRVYLPMYWRAEKEVALRLRELTLAVRSERVRGASGKVSAFEKQHSILFSDLQRQAILNALGNGVFVITGGPGTGKTTIINCILELLSAYDVETVLCAPTGRAAKRMTEATGAEAKTIHRLLEYSRESGAFTRNEENPIEADCVIADEASMIDLTLMRALLRAIEPGTRLILVGDADQLPSVGAGNVLGDILESGQVPCVRLTDIFRQSGTSRIVMNAHLIQQGKMPVLNEKGTDFFFEPKSSLSEAAETVAALAASRLPAYFGYPAEKSGTLSMHRIQVLAPSRKGECGVNALNLLLQDRLNPPEPQIPELSWGDTVFRLGDKVIQTRNDYEQPWERNSGGEREEGAGVFNGDVGFVTEVDRNAHALMVRFDDDRDAVYEGAALENLQLAYCLSVHKSQGSEFPVVIMPVISGPSMLLTRNLLYTAMTRAREMVVLVGSREMIRRMVENDHEIRRYTTLAQRLREAGEIGG